MNKHDKGLMEKLKLWTIYDQTCLKGPLDNPFHSVVMSDKVKTLHKSHIDYRFVYKEVLCLPWHKKVFLPK